MVQAGDKIEEIETGKILEVEGLWGNASKIIDFSARYTTTNLVDRYHNKVFGNRGFRFQDEEIVWRKVN